MNPFHEETSLLLQMARDAGTLLQKFFGQSIDVREKGPLDLVTEADFASETLIREGILQRFPTDAITAEESGEAGASSRRWYIDPLDGTVNFAHGVPLFAVCIAFFVDNTPQAGVVFNPVARECYTAVRGEGAFLNGLPLRCSQTARLADAHSFVNPHGLRNEAGAESLLNAYRKIGRAVQGILNPGSMSTGLCWVGGGRLDAAAALNVDQFSTPASALIMAEAGVTVTDLDGAAYRPGSSTLLAASPILHPALLNLMASRQ